MTHAEIGMRNGASNRRWRPTPRGMIAPVLALKAWRQEAAMRKALADLTHDQLADIGRDNAPRPTFGIKAGLITTLMSMR